MGAFIPIIHASRADRPDEADTVAAAESVAAALRRLGYRPEVIALDLDFSVLERLAERRPLAVFNLVEAVRGDTALSAAVPALLENLGLPFTGAGAGAYMATLSKLPTKQALTAAGLPTPAWWRAEETIPERETVIVKSVWEHASYGIDTESVVPASSASAQIATRAARFGGPFFAERFIAGREFNISILEGDNGPEILPIPEISFEALPVGRPHIVDYEAKWHADSAAYRQTPRRFGLESQSPALAAVLADLALTCWQLFDLAGYARVDFRVDETARPFILEVNVNPCLAPDAGFAAAAAEAGLTYDAAIAGILRAATRSKGESSACCAS